MNSIPRWLLPSIALAAILASASIAFRYKVEARNKAATIAVEIETVESQALSQGVPLDKALLNLKAHGLGALVLSEETVGDLITSHQIEVFPGPVLKGSDAVLKRLSDSIDRRFPNLSIKPVGGQIDLTAPEMPTIFNLRMLGVGLDDGEALAARTAGLRIIGRFGNPLGASDHYVQATLEQAKSQGADIFLPVGDQVLGRRSATKTLEDTMTKLGMYYASPEFAKLGGDANIVSDVPELVLRLHSAQAAELDKLPPSEAVDRYAKAARERNQRLLLLRALDFGSSKSLDEMGEFITNVSKEIYKQGGAIGVAKPFEDSKVPKPLFALIGLALAPGIWFSVAYFVKDQRVRLVGAVLIGLLGLACYSPQARPAMAFLSAVAFPIVAFQFLEARNGKIWLVEYLIVTAVSLVGGLGVAGLMNGLPYFIRAEQFEGVKVAVFFPVVVVALLLYARLSNLKSSLNGTITWSQMALTLLLLGGMAFMISRTGNDNPAGVSGAELKLRSLLDTLLFVRPRTKEFMIGHPFLIVGICMLIKLRSGWKAPAGFAGWTVLALTMGAIGQTDIVNTMCHFHTPVALSLERIGVGLVAGGILGSLVWAVLNFLLPRIGTQTGLGELSPERSEIAH